MTQSTPEDPAAQATYRPMPGPPSPRWRRAAAGLAWMRYATLASVALHAVSTVARVVAFASVVDGRARFDAANQLGVYAGIGELIANVALGAGLWQLGALPASTRAKEPARLSFWFLVASVVMSVAVAWVIGPLSRAAGLNPTSMSACMLLRGILTLVLHAAYLGMLVRALDVALRSVGAALPRWAPQVVAAFIGWRVFSIPAQSLLLMFQRGVISYPWMALSLAADAAFAAALVTLLSRSERVLERQESGDGAG